MTTCGTCRRPLPHQTNAAKFVCRVVGQMMRSASVDADGKVTIVFREEQ